MVCYLLYNRQTPAERTMAEMAERLIREDIEVELTDADSPRGIQLAESYQIMGRPAILLIKSDGVPLEIWQGTELPPLSDITYLAHQ
jgi:hypothetical protein